MSTFLLDEHVVLVVALQVVDVGIDGGITPIEEDTWFGEFGEGLVSIAIDHTVVFVALVETPDGIVDEVTTLITIGPHIIRIPEDLRCPHTIDLAPVGNDVQ